MIIKYNNLEEMKGEMDELFPPDMPYHERKVVLDVSVRERNLFYRDIREVLALQFQDAEFSPNLPEGAKGRLLSGQTRLSILFLPEMGIITIKNAKDVSNEI